MSNTANLSLPLVQQAQAQKHITVNEALSILDGVAQLTLESVSQLTPPVNAVDGQIYLVPDSPSGDWVYKSGLLAIFFNGGWSYIAPKNGWRAYVKSEDRCYTFDGTEWVGDAISLTTSGAGVTLETLEFDVNVVAGVIQSTSNVIPVYSTVTGVTGRVTSQIQGSLASWSLGVADSKSRYGSGLSTDDGAWVYGVSGPSMTYYQETPLVISAEGGTFTSGTIRLAVHLTRLRVPRA